VLLLLLLLHQLLSVYLRGWQYFPVHLLLNVVPDGTAVSTRCLAEPARVGERVDDGVLVRKPHDAVLPQHAVLLEAQSLKEFPEG
jgi:hypothetical protein